MVAIWVAVMAVWTAYRHMNTTAGLIAVVLGPGIGIIAYQRLGNRIAIFAFHCAVVVIMIYLHILASCELIAGVLGAGIAIVAVPWAMHACRPVIGIDGAFVSVIAVYRRMNAIPLIAIIEV
jgi:hypothetical protein